MAVKNLEEEKVLIDEFGEPLVDTTKTVASNSAVGNTAGVNSSSSAVNPNKSQISPEVKEMTNTILNNSAFTKFVNGGKIVADAIARGVKNKGPGQIIGGHYVPSGILVPDLIGVLKDKKKGEALAEEKAYQRKSQEWEKAFRERGQNHNIDVSNRGQDRADLQYLTNEEQRALNNDFRQKQFEDNKSNTEFNQGIQLSQIGDQRDISNKQMELEAEKLRDSRAYRDSQLDLEREKLQASKLEKEVAKEKNQEKQAQELKVAIEKGREVADIFNKMPDDYFGGGGINAISRSVGKFFGTENSQDAERVRSAGNRMMIESLKSTFGGNISDGERTALTGILSDFSVPKDRLYANLQNEVKSMLATRGLDTNLVNEILPPLRSDNQYNPDEWEG